MKKETMCYQTAIKVVVCWYFLHV